MTRYDPSIAIKCCDQERRFDIKSLLLCIRDVPPQPTPLTTDLVHSFCNRLILQRQHSLPHHFDQSDSMADSKIPAEAPPAYNDVVGGSSSTSSRPQQSSKTSHLDVPDNHHIPAPSRRSMEDENRPLPKGWIRSFDSDSHHQFFVDTSKDPPRSIWVHPYDDEQYLSTLTSEDRERIEQESMNRGKHPSKADIMASHTDDEEDDYTSPTSPNGKASYGELPPRPEGKGKGKAGFGRKFKDKVTGTTHEQREAERKQRAEEEKRIYDQHLKIRKAMGEAQRTGEPVYIGKDKDGKDLYMEPPGYRQASPYSNNGVGYDPYSNGVYTTPNARYIRPPQQQYGRPAGYGYGGGYGLPIGK